MSKNQTPWSNNDVKPNTSWANNDVKPQVSWSNNITKRTAVFTETPKNDTPWSETIITAVAWLYDDPTQKYDDTPIRGYDYLIPISNQLNNKNLTPWGQVV